MMSSSRLSHPVTILGVGLATIGAVLFLIVFALDLFGFHTNPYIGILFVLYLQAMALYAVASLTAALAEGPPVPDEPSVETAPPVA